jgi:hypothetical protein
MASGATSPEERRFLFCRVEFCPISSAEQVPACTAAWSSQLSAFNEPTEMLNKVKSTSSCKVRSYFSTLQHLLRDI